MPDSNQSSDEPEHLLFEATVETSNEKRKVVPFLLNQQVCNGFAGSAVQNGPPKIYVVRNSGFRIVYVGKTTQSLKVRLGQGLNPRPGTGYHGYHWQDKEKVYIHCFVFAGIDDKELEATEAELVYQIRLNSGLWPGYQTEIHFHNTDTAPERAKRLYEFLDEIGSQTRLVEST